MLRNALTPKAKSADHKRPDLHLPENGQGHTHDKLWKLPSKISPELGESLKEEVVRETKQGGIENSIGLMTEELGRNETCHK